MAHRSGPLLRISVAGLALALSAGAALAESQGRVSAGSGPVRAKVSFVRYGYVYRRLRLRIIREQRTWVSAFLGVTYFRPPKLHVRDLDADGEPEVWLDTYTGGAHCCDESRFFHWVPSRRTYAGTFRSWADVGYRAKNLDGRGDVELVSSDARFAYVFTSFADSFFPLQIWQLERGRLRDVTRLFPGQVEQDASELWRTNLERRRKGDVRGVLAAWMADQYLLGREQKGWDALDAAKRRGELNEGAGWPSGSRYLRALRAYLVKTGYAVR